jgi:hypothetical protein
MAVLACLSIFRIAVRALEPLPEGIIDDRFPENPEMTGRTYLAVSLELRVSVFTRGHVVEWACKELMAFERTAELERHYPRPVFKRKAGDGIELHVPDLMAEITVDTFGADALHLGRIRIVGSVHGGCGKMAGRAVAGVAGLIELISGTKVR